MGGPYKATLAARAYRGLMSPETPTSPAPTSAVDVPHVDVTRDGAVATVALNRPDAMNATSSRTGRELLAAIQAAGDDPAVRAIVITGRGRAFCAGADMQALDGPVLPSGRPDLERILREIFNPIVVAIREAPVPVIAAVNGPAVGVGMSIALACDLVLASDRAAFIVGFSAVGLSLDGGLSVLLPARVGVTKAAELALLSPKLGAEAALAMGLVNEVVAADELGAAAATLAARLAAGPRSAQAATKALLNATAYAGLTEALDREATSQGIRVTTNEYAEGVIAFLERRPPRFA